jgi:hypothetical protein
MTNQYLHSASSTGHSATLHGFKSFAFPKHFPFPFELQLRIRFCTPGPQVFEQDEKGLHSDQTGSVTNLGFTVKAD